MDKIISVSELYELAKEMRDDGMKYVSLSFMEPEDDMPAAIHFEAAKKDLLSGWVDFEEIKIVDLKA